jgi:hypothetical protein
VIKRILGPIANDPKGVSFDRSWTVCGLAYAMLIRPAGERPVGDPLPAEAGQPPTKGLEIGPGPWKVFSRASGTATAPSPDPERLAVGAAHAGLRGY